MYYGYQQPPPYAYQPNGYGYMQQPPPNFQQGNIKLRHFLIPFM